MEISLATNLCFIKEASVVLFPPGCWHPCVPFALIDQPHLARAYPNILAPPFPTVSEYLIIGMLTFKSMQISIQNKSPPSL